MRTLFSAAAGTVLLASLMVACTNEAPTPDPVPQQSEPESAVSEVTEPRAEKRHHEITTHGDTRIDEYYWLRDDSRTDPEVLAYLEAENDYFDEQMAHTEELQETLYKEMTARLDPDDSSVPYEWRGYWYYYRYEPGKDYEIYARRKGTMDAEEEILLDANRRAEGEEFYDVRGYAFTDDHRYMAVAEDVSGRRINTIRILDTQTGKWLDTEIGNTEGSLAWSADGQYLFYIDKDPQTLRGYRFMRHKLGTDPSEDVLIYAEMDEAYYNGVGRSRSGDYIVMYHGRTDTSEVRMIPADDPLAEPRVFLPREMGHEYTLAQVGDTFYILTNWEAENNRVMSATWETAGDRSQWKEVIPHSEDSMVHSIVALDNWLVASERRDGLMQVRVLARDGSVDRYLDADAEAYVMRLTGNITTNTDKVRYSYSSMVTPRQVWEVDLATGESELLKTTQILGDFDSDNYRTARLSVTARDGTEIPVSMAWHKDTALDGSAPALVYSYGSYGSSTEPRFWSSSVSLMDRGFVYVIAHIRGGQEMGRKWYEQGRLLNKKNTFTDFIDVTRALQAQGKIDPKRTFAMGGSAGGLLMGAVINMAPELYQGVIAQVPFVDVVTTMLDPSIPLTTGEWREWGDPRQKEYYDYMLSYSPYDQVSAQDYPNLMITTGLHDSQVQYFEPAKWVARLRDKRTDDNRLIMYTNMDAGHGGASGRYQAYRETAQEFAFMVDLANIER